MHSNSLFIYCVSGFLQSRGRYHGLLALREKLIHLGFNRGIRSRVEYLTWRESFSQVASDLQNICTHHGRRPIVVIAGYSYGGWGALQLARELDGRGIPVRELVLSDPVGRPWWLWTPIPAPTSLLSRAYAPAFSVPANVLRVAEFYQRMNRPQGRRLTSRHETTQFDLPIELPINHDRMDDAPLFHERVVTAAYRARHEHLGSENDQCDG